MAKMRFDFVPFFNPGENLPWTRIMEMIREQTILAEQADFTTVWMTEHHFAHNGYLNASPNPVLVCADLAARTSKIRLGQAPIVLPDWHPLRVAEDVAMLDNLSGGRVDFGVGRGTNERACLQFNMKPEADKRNDKESYALFRECLDIILKAWTEDPFTYDGEFYKLPMPGWFETNRMFEPWDERYHKADGEYKAMYIHPRVVQAPHPPVWMMSNAPFTYEFAGKEGHNLIGMSGAKANINACWNAYKKGAEEAGRNVKLGNHCGMCTVVYVADSFEQGAKDLRESVNLYYEFLAGARPSGEWMKQAYLPKGDELTATEKDADWFDFLTGRNIIWVGTADYVAEQLEEWQTDCNVNHLMLLQQFPNFPFEKIMASMDKFAKDVMPRFQ